MKYIIALVLLAVALDIRISDNDGQVLSVNSSNYLTITQTNDGSTGTGRAKDIRVSDNAGDVASITAGGALNVAWA